VKAPSQERGGDRVQKTRARIFAHRLSLRILGTYLTAPGCVAVAPSSAEIYACSSNNTLASWRSAVSKPSVNQA
jgi:hypothetical protein